LIEECFRLPHLRRFDLDDALVPSFAGCFRQQSGGNLGGKLNSSSAQKNNPWDIRDPAPSGDATADPVFASVGRALTEWERMETGWALIFAALIGAPKGEERRAPAIRAYGSVPSFTGRSEMLRRAGEGYFHLNPEMATKVADRFKEALSLTGKFSARRNEIAHGQVHQFFVYTDEARQASRAAGFYLLPSLFNPRKTGLDYRVEYQYTAADVDYYGREFLKLRGRAQALRDDLTNGQELDAGTAE
jgi:hypothetical protein